MDFSDFIKKTLENGRGYKYHKYQTEYDGKIFKLHHYHTKILEVETSNSKMEIKEYYDGSVSDKQATNRALYAISKDCPSGDNGYYFGSTYSFGLGNKMFKVIGGNIFIIYEDGNKDEFLSVRRIKRFKDVLLLENILNQKHYYVYKVPRNIKNRKFHISKKDNCLYSQFPHKMISSEPLPLNKYSKYITALMI